MVLVGGRGVVHWAACAGAPAPYGLAIHLHGEPQRPMGARGWPGMPGAGLGWPAAGGACGVRRDPQLWAAAGRRGGRGSRTWTQAAAARLESRECAVWAARCASLQKPGPRVGLPDTMNYLVSVAAGVGNAHPGASGCGPCTGLVETALPAPGAGPDRKE